MKNIIAIMIALLVVGYMVWYASKVDTMVETHQTCTDSQGGYIAPEC